MTCSTRVCFSVLTNCPYFLTMAVVPSLCTLFVPTCTKTDPLLPEPTMFSTLSVIAFILAQGKQTTTSSPLSKTLSVFLTIDSPQTPSFSSSPHLSLPQNSSSVGSVPSHSVLQPCHLADCYHSLSPYQPVTFPSRLLANLHSRRLPS